MHREHVPTTPAMFAPGSKSSNSESVKDLLKIQQLKKREREGLTQNPTTEREWGEVFKIQQERGGRERESLVCTRVHKSVCVICLGRSVQTPSLLKREVNVCLRSTAWKRRVKPRFMMRMMVEEELGVMLMSMRICLGATGIMSH